MRLYSIWVVLAACKMHVGRVMVEKFHGAGSSPTVCCTVPVKTKLGTFALHGRVKMFVCLKARETGSSHIYSSFC